MITPRIFIATHATLLVLAYSCSQPGLPELPTVEMISPDAVDTRGAHAWDALGFRVAGPVLTECSRRWYESDDYACTITIGVVIEPGLIERTGSDAAASREFRTVYLDDDLSGSLDIAIAHEVGHILLDTPRHTQGGVMGGASAELRDVDYELACETIGVCR